MLEASQIVDLLTTAGTLAMVACPILAVATAGAARIAWEQSTRRELAQGRADALARRLEDVEALRKRDQWQRGEMNLDGVTSREQAERLARRERARLDSRKGGGPIPPAFPDDGREGTDVRDLHSPPECDNVWHDFPAGELGPECLSCGDTEECGAYGPPNGWKGFGSLPAEPLYVIEPGDVEPCIYRFGDAPPIKAKGNTFAVPPIIREHLGDPPFIKVAQPDYERLGITDPEGQN